MERVLSDYGTPLTSVPSFKYSGEILLSSNENWTVVEQNLRRSQGKWGGLANILGREGADRRTVGRFYVVAVQAVILFGSETWVLNPWLEKSLKGFHHWAVWRMEGMVPKPQQGGTWVYKPIGALLSMVGLD